MAIHNWDYAPEALEVQVSELLLATADRSDELVDENVRLVLQELRQGLPSVQHVTKSTSR